MSDYLVLTNHHKPNQTYHLVPVHWWEWPILWLAKRILRQGKHRRCIEVRTITTTGVNSEPVPPLREASNAALLGE